MHKLESVLRICCQNNQSEPDIHGIIRRDPAIEPNPLLCNKILEQTTSRLIRGIDSNRIGQFDLTECKMIKQRIISIQNRSESGRRRETLFKGEVSVYDEGTKNYIESNKLLYFASEFLWKAIKEADRPVQLSGLNETKPPFDY